MEKTGKTKCGAVKTKICPLCRRHSKMETIDGTKFWIEWGPDGMPRLCMDSTGHGGGMNTLCINACPLCGGQLGRMEADDEE